MAENDLSFNIGANVEDFLKGVDKVKKTLGTVSDSVKSVGDSAKQLGSDLVDKLAGSPAFDELNKLTGGLAQNFIGVGKAVFGAITSVKALGLATKAALIGTGIGAFVVLLGTIAANWDDIKTAVVGVDTEQRKIAASLESQLATQQTALDLLNASDNILKLQGKTQKEINDLKIAQNVELLRTRLLEIENTKVSLKQAQIRQKANALLIEGLLGGTAQFFKLFTKVLNEAAIAFGQFITTAAKIAIKPAKLFAQAFDAVIGSELEAKIDGLGKTIEGALQIPDFSKDINAGIDRIVDKAVKVLNPDLTSGLEDGLKDAELAAAKLENTLAGLNLSNIEIAKKEAEALAEILSRPKNLEALDTGGLTVAPIKTSLEIDTTGFKKGFKGLKATVTEEGLALIEAIALVNDQISATLSDGLFNTLAGVGTAIGNAFATGANVAQATGQALLSGIGAIVTDLGKLLIKTGVGLIAVKLALKSLNPAVAIAAGVALVALGSAFSKGAGGLSGQIGGGGAGGGSGSSSGGGVSANQTNVTQSNGGGGFGGRVIFEIAGDKLIGVINNSVSADERIGVGTAVNIG